MRRPKILLVSPGACFTVLGGLFTTHPMIMRQAPCPPALRGRDLLPGCESLRAYLLKEQLRAAFVEAKGARGRGLLACGLVWGWRCRIPEFVNVMR